MTYLILDFNTTENGPDGEKLLLRADRTTDDSGQSRDQPLEIPIGTYYLTLRLAYEEPIETTNSKGEMEDHFEKQMWHIEIESAIVIPEQPMRPILVICKPQGSMGQQLTLS
uniref:Uncharacterized protein n=1 Tax=Talaromyces marneffei PM1 TaxID=1077442 RepID=A0A093UWI0_TALMA